MHKVMMSAILALLLSGCSFVDRHASGMAEQLKPNQCTTQTTQVAPDYSTTSSYRCVGEGCQDYGCNQ
jgi:PBP1b-binding outer membrane lipoprotein LpoB